MLAGTLSVLVCVCSVITADRKYVKDDPAKSEKIQGIASAAGMFGFPAVLAALPICCFLKTKRNHHSLL